MIKSPPQAKASLSQNFLFNLGIQTKVASWIKLYVDGSDFLIEIGPGKGDLTKHFLTWNKPLLALEIDARMVDYLNLELDSENLELVQTDAREYFLENLDQLKLKGEICILSNLPFHVGSRILMDLPILLPRASFAVVLQKEVAKKIAPGSKITLFSAWLGFFYNLSLGPEIAAGNFIPRPKVDAACLAGKPREILPSPDFNRKKFLEVLKLIFNSSRKTLAVNLKNLFSAEEITEFYKQVNLPLDTRINQANSNEILGWLLTFMMQKGLV